MVPMAGAKESSAEEVPSLALPAPIAPSPWILDRRSDLALIIATPLIVLPAVLAVSTRVRWEEIALFVGAFGATGHHLPGMLRAYGDRALFRRYRVRFIVAPILLGAACVASVVLELGGIFLVAYAWGIWHAVMQTYGMARIYDAKRAPYSALASRLDWLLCVSWFGAGTLLSPARMGNLLTTFYESGGPFVSPELLAGIRAAWMAGTSLVTVAYALHLLHAWRIGRPVSGVKLLLLFASCGFWWYTTVAVRHMLVGIALWEICHDVQYLTIVWVFNRGRVARDPGVGAFTRFLFRGSPALVGAYLGLVIGYGALGWFGVRDHGAAWNGVLEGLLVASGLLHFYFDGFIWKLRDRATGSPLGLRRDASLATWHDATWLRHATAWSLVVIPVVALAAVQSRGVASVAERLDAVLAVVPAFTDGYEKRGLVRTRAGELVAAERDFEQALQLQPDHLDAQIDLLLLRARRAERLEAKLALTREALALREDDPRTHQLLAVRLDRAGQSDAAIVHYRAALDAKPDFARAHFGLAAALERRGAHADARAHFEAGLRSDPEDVDARLAMARLLVDAREIGPP